MINDFKKDHYHSLFEELPLIKNISFKMDTGNYILLDNRGNNYICDIYGRQKPIFKKNISGYINGEQRKILKRVKSHSNIMHSNYKQNYLENKPKEDSKSYFPSIGRFEGYTHFPRPVCPPFSNIPEYIINQSYKKIIISQCENKLEVNENKKVFAKSNENCGLSYLTSDVKSYIDKEKENESKNSINNINSKKIDDKLFLIKMIDNTIEDYKIKYKCGLKELINNHSIIRAILDFKKNIINNNETNIINGRILKRPNISMIKEYKIIHNQLFNNNAKKNILQNQHQRLIKCFSQLNIKKNIFSKNNENNNLYGHKLLKKISFNKSISNNENQSLSQMKNEDEINNNSKELFINLKKKRDNMNNMNKIIISKNIYEEQETKESLGTKPNNNKLLNIRNNTIESNKEDNISVISILNEKENNKFIKFNKKIKYLKSLKKESEKEKKQLEGYQKEEPKKPKIMDMNIEEELPKYRDFGEIYKKEQETLEKLNPILFNLQKKKDDNDIKKLKMKKHFKKLNEKVIMKGKKLKIKKSPSE